MEKMQYEEQRGKHRVSVGLKNKQAVLDWFLKHPYATQKRCSAEIGLSRLTVGKYLKVIIAEQEGRDGHTG